MSDARKKAEDARVSASVTMTELEKHLEDVAQELSKYFASKKLLPYSLRQIALTATLPTNDSISLLVSQSSHKQEAALAELESKLNQKIQPYDVNVFFPWFVKRVSKS